MGHAAGVNCLAWSPDSNTLASGADDKLIRLWDRLSAEPKAGTVQHQQRGSTRNFPKLALKNGTLAGHSHFVVSLAFSPKGNQLASGSFDEAVFIWDVRTGTCVMSLPAHSDPVYGLDFCPDGTMVVSSSTDGLIRIWDTLSGQCLRTLVHEDNPAVTVVVFSPNGRYVLAWSLDGCVRLWDYVKGVVKKTYQGHSNAGFAIGGCFAFGCEDEDEPVEEGPGLAGEADGMVDEGDGESGEDTEEDESDSDASGASKGEKPHQKRRCKKQQQRPPHQRHRPQQQQQQQQQPHQKTVPTYVVSPSEDGRLLIWDVSSKQLVQTLQACAPTPQRKPVSDKKKGKRPAANPTKNGDDGVAKADHRRVCYWADAREGVLVTAGGDGLVRVWTSDRLQGINKKRTNAVNREAATANKNPVRLKTEDTEMGGLS